MFIYEYFRILKWVTKREYVTSQVRKYTKGYCYYNNLNLSYLYDLSYLYAFFVDTLCVDKREVTVLD